jgi:thymidylate synthase (FAD)
VKKIRAGIVLDPPTKVLDHGYIQIVDYWGSDEDIIRAARMSTDKGFKGWPEDEKLLRYLYENGHHTPFEMAGMTFEIQAPIFVFRQWHRHRTQSYNEMSARYTPLPDVDYVPSVSRLTVKQDPKNRQAQGVATGLTPQEAMGFRNDLASLQEAAQALYEGALDAGVPKELARLCIPTSRYSRMRASANLRNWMHFLELRIDPHAQWEIRQYANVIANTYLYELFPRTYGLFMEGK